VDRLSTIATRGRLAALALGLGLSLATLGPAGQADAEDPDLTGDCCTREEFSTVWDSVEAGVGNVVEDDEALAQKIDGNDLRQDDDDDDDDHQERRRH
jgi:hypothetical protein